MSDEGKAKEFYCNVNLINALIHFLSVNEKKRTQEWVTKLKEISDGTSESKCRNEYSHYLLINLQNGTLTQPFDKSPPPGKLKPLCRILPDYLYDEVVKQIKISHCKFLKVISGDFEMPNLGCAPRAFQSEQPRPLKGVMALCAAFSNYEEDNMNCKK